MWCAHSTEFQSSTTEEDPLPFGTSFGGPSFATRYRADVHKILASEDQTPSLALMMNNLLRRLHPSSCLCCHSVLCKWLWWTMSPSLPSWRDPLKLKLIYKCVRRMLTRISAGDLELLRDEIVYYGKRVEEHLKESKIPWSSYRRTGYMTILSLIF